MSRSTFGVLLTNVGTPDAPSPKAVKQYLAEFLSDPAIVAIPKALWWPLLNGIILKTRPRKSAALYEKIWRQEGSPLLVACQKMMHKLKQLSDSKGFDAIYALGMRYGNPNLAQALITLQQQGVQNLIVLPLYPQYSTTTTASTLKEINRQLIDMAWQPTLYPITYYAHEESYINALAFSVRQQWQQQPPGQLLLFSFHGIPQSKVVKGDPYYSHCLSTAHLVAKALNLSALQWRIVFQSRFGYQKWLQPYCVEVLQQLPPQGYRSIDIICPGFPADCLETLEEIAQTNKAIFLQSGGKSYNYIPALNETETHIECLFEIINKKRSVITSDVS